MEDQNKVQVRWIFKSFFWTHNHQSKPWLTWLYLLNCDQYLITLNMDWIFNEIYLHINIRSANCFELRIEFMTLSKANAGDLSILHLHRFIWIIGYHYDIITLSFIMMLHYYNRLLHSSGKCGTWTLNFLASRQTWIGFFVLFPPCLPGKGTKYHTKVHLGLSS